MVLAVAGDTVSVKTADGAGSARVHLETSVDGGMWEKMPLTLSSAEPTRIAWTSQKGMDGALVTFQIRAEINYAFLNVLASPASENRLIRLTLSLDNQGGVLPALLRLPGNLVAEEGNAISHLPVWTLRSLDDKGVTQRITTVRVGFAPGDSPRWVGFGNQLASVPVQWERGAYLSFAVSPYGGAGTQACETVNLPELNLYSHGASYTAKAYNHVISNRIVNNCTQAELIVYHDAIDSYIGVASGTEAMTWATFKLWKGNFEQNLLPYGITCNKSGGTGHEHCSVVNAGASSKYTQVLWHQGTWWGNAASIWTPVTIGQSYTVDGSAKAQDAANADRKTSIGTA
ncbi:MAG: hypothetical protein LC624_08720 [Halobacteriales archaeon]|nr:hypothetical protein [Halobacteriales archaeon]